MKIFKKPRSTAQPTQSPAGVVTAIPAYRTPLQRLRPRLALLMGLMVFSATAGCAALVTGGGDADMTWLVTASDIHVEAYAEADLVVAAILAGEQPAVRTARNIAFEVPAGVIADAAREGVSNHLDGTVEAHTYRAILHDGTRMDLVVSFDVTVPGHPVLSGVSLVPHLEPAGTPSGVDYCSASCPRLSDAQEAAIDTFLAAYTGSDQEALVAAIGRAGLYPHLGGGFVYEPASADVVTARNFADDMAAARVEFTVAAGEQDVVLALDLLVTGLTDSGFAHVVDAAPAGLADELVPYGFDLTPADDIQ